MKEKTEDIMKVNGLYLEEFLHKNQSPAARLSAPGT